MTIDVTRWHLAARSLRALHEEIEALLDEFEALVVEFEQASGSPMRLNAVTCGVELRAAA